MEKEEQHEVVIVGAGIAGLATAVALKRVGLPSLVLERSPELRATGTIIGLFPNAWRALEALNIAHKLTPFCPVVNRARVTDLSSGTTREVLLSGTDGSDSGGRLVHRKALIEALAEELQPGTIRYSSKIVSIDQQGSSSSPVTALHLDDGSVIRAKVVIGCDGVHSVVARWLGLAEPVNSGRSAVRGLAVFPEGHGFKNEAVQYVGEGKRGGLAPLDDKELYWFITHTSIAKEKEMSAAEPELIMAEVRENLAKDFPSELQMALRHVDLFTLYWAPLMFRVPWDLLLGRTHQGCVAVVGDAMHPMTPDLGQGGCTALEDAVVLGRCLARAQTSAQFAVGIDNYVKERRWRVARIVAAAYVSGWVQQGGTTGVWQLVAEWFRRRVYYKFAHPKIMEAITGYDCGELPPAEGDSGIRSVHRKALLEALAEELQPGTIRFSSKIVSIDQEGSSSSSATALRLDDGSVIRAKVVIGCDGVHSVVARWLGLTEPVNSGRSAVRGLAVFPEDHGIKNEALMYQGDGKRGGLVPLNKKELYWFISTHTSIAKEKEMMAAEPELIMAEVRERLAKDFPSELQMALRHVDLSTLSWAPLMLRVPWDLLLGRTHRGCVAVAGDAMHPMTPEIGQGGCAALEDAVVLGRCLARARTPAQFAAGVDSYVKERRWRVAGVVAAAYLSGWVQQGGTSEVWRPVVKWFRRSVYYRFIHPRIVEAIRGYHCGQLPPAE